MTAESGTPSVVRAGEGERLHLFDYPAVCKVSSRVTESDFILLEANILPSVKARRHRHRFEDEAIYIVEGRFALELEERILIGNTGDFLFVPRGLRHGLCNIGTKPGRLLLLLAPGDVEALFREVARVRAETNNSLSVALHQ